MHKILELLNVAMLMEPTRFLGFLDGYRRLHALAKPDSTEKQKRVLATEEGPVCVYADDSYAITPGGIAIIGVFGPMYKGYGAYGYADQSQIRGTVRQAANDPNVNGIMLLIDSPGGSVSGTPDLYSDVATASASKPVVAYIEDCGCSAAYWTAAGAGQIYSNGGMVGSVGVVTALVDSSKYFEAAGIKVIPIVTGEMKAVGMDGTPVTPQQVAYVQDMIDSIYDDFVNAVAKSRGIRGETVRKMEAKVFYGQAAVDAKLIDAVMPFDKALANLTKAAKKPGSNNRAKAMIAIEEMEG